MAVNPEQRKIPIASVVFDEQFYVRWAIDQGNVRRLADAIRTGAQLPPIGVQLPSHRLIYGAHRLRAHELVYGPDAEILADLFEVDDKTAIEMALQENARHGMPMRQIDLRRAVIVAERFALGDAQIVRALSIPPGRLMDLRAARGTYRRGAAVETVPLKGSMLHLAGRELTAEQYQATQSAPGPKPSLLARQLTVLLHAKAFDMTDDRARLTLRLLRDVLVDMDLDTPWGEDGTSDTARAAAV